MKRIICVLLSVCMLLCLAACGGAHKPTTQDTEPVTQTEGSAMKNETTNPPKDLEDPSLAIFRQAMVETPQLFAVAFFGYVLQNADPFALCLLYTSPSPRD